MEKSETKNLLKHIENSYSGFKVSKEMFEYWVQELQDYDFEDINTRLKQLMGEEKYSHIPPLLEALTKGLTRKSNKVDFSKQVIGCKHCRRLFNDLEETHIHEDRCSAIKYIERQYKRFNLGVIDNSKKYELYNMSEEEFDKKYKTILKFIQQQTTNDFEKQLIQNIFVTPSAEQAKQIIG